MPSNGGGGGAGVRGRGVILHERFYVPHTALHGYCLLIAVCVLCL